MYPAFRSSFFYEFQTINNSKQNDLGNNSLNKYFNNFIPNDSILKNISIDNYYEENFNDINIKIQRKNGKNHIIIGNELNNLSLNFLIELLTNSTSKNSELFDICLYSYNYFTTDILLFEALLYRYKINFPINLSPSEKMRFFENKIAPIQAKILIFLGFWLKTNQYKILQNVILEKTFEQLLFYMFLEKFKFRDCDNNIWNLIIRLEEIRVQRNYIKNYEYNKMIFKNNITCIYTELIQKIYLIIKMNNEIISQQICLFDFDNFKKISFEELISKNYINYTYYLRFFNLISRNIAFILIKEVKKKKKIKIFIMFILLIDQLILYNNFKTAFAAYLGITHPSLTKFKLNNKLNHHQRKKFENIQNIFDNSHNQISLRNHQMKAISPCIPFLGLYTKDLFFGEENNKLNQEKKKNLIDFKRVRTISEIGKKIEIFKESDYPFEKDEQIIKYLRFLPDISDDYLYELSSSQLYSLK